MALENILETSLFGVYHPSFHTLIIGVVSKDPSSFKLAKLCCLSFDFSKKLLHWHLLFYVDADQHLTCFIWTRIKGVIALLSSRSLKCHFQNNDVPLEYFQVLGIARR